MKIEDLEGDGPVCGARLQGAGVRTTTMAEANAARALVRRMPAEGVVQGWIEQAHALAKVVTH